MILDATAGNRVMWRDKNNDYIIYIDIQQKLERKPTVFADNSQTPFPDKTFNTIFYDPPHAWSWDSILWGCPDAESWKRDNRKYPTYYGMEIYKSKVKWISHLWHAQKELYRILKDDGLLWLKWVELRIKLEKALTVFQNEWKELLRFYAKSPFQQAGDYQKTWSCLGKKQSQQKSLIESCVVR